MAKLSDSMDSVFDDGLDFDVIFDREDSLIDTVNGVKENGTSFLEAEMDADIVTGDVGHIPGELKTDDDGHTGPQDGKKELADWDAEIAAKDATPNSSEEKSYDDGNTPGQFKNFLGYKESTGAAAEEEEEAEKECKESADLDDQLVDESFLDPDDYMLDESALDPVDEEVDPEEELMDIVDNNDGAGTADAMDYNPEIDDDILNDMI